MANFGVEKKSAIFNVRSRRTKQLLYLITFFWTQKIDYFLMLFSFNFEKRKIEGVLQFFSSEERRLNGCAVFGKRRSNTFQAIFEEPPSSKNHLPIFEKAARLRRTFPSSKNIPIFEEPSIYDLRKRKIEEPPIFDLRSLKRRTSHLQSSIFGIEDRITPHLGFWAPMLSRKSDIRQGGCDFFENGKQGSSKMRRGSSIFLVLRTKNPPLSNFGAGRMRNPPSPFSTFSARRTSNPSHVLLLSIPSSANRRQDRSAILMFPGMHCMKRV